VVVNPRSRRMIVTGALLLLLALVIVGMVISPGR
jgi:type II secretory pathway component PulM